MSQVSLKIGSGVLEQLTAIKQLQPVENLNHPLLSFFLPAIVANRGPSILRRWGKTEHGDFPVAYAQELHGRSSVSLTVTHTRGHATLSVLFAGEDISVTYTQNLLRSDWNF